MDRDTIIRLAREAGFVVDEVSQQHQPNCIFHTRHMVDELLERFAALVESHMIRTRLLDEVGEAIMREREDCARVAENQWEIPGTQRRTAERCAAAIRSRSRT